MFELKQRTDNPVNTVPVRPDTTCRISVCSSASAGDALLKPAATIGTFVLHLTPEIIDYAPIFHYIKPWLDGRYSEQCLRRMLTIVRDQATNAAAEGLSEFRMLHFHNAKLIEALLAALDEREESRAA